MQQKAKQRNQIDCNNEEEETRQIVEMDHQLMIFADLFEQIIEKAGLAMIVLVDSFKCVEIELDRFVQMTFQHTLI